MTQRGNLALHPSHAPGFLPPIVTAGTPETGHSPRAVACPSASPDDSTLNLRAPSASPPVPLVGGPQDRQATHQRRAPTRHGPVTATPAPAQFRRATTVGGIGVPVQKRSTLQLVRLSQRAASPAPAACHAASHAPIHQAPGSHHQPGVRVVRPIGIAGAWPLVEIRYGEPPRLARAPPRNTLRLTSSVLVTRWSFGGTNTSEAVRTGC